MKTNRTAALLGNNPQPGFEPTIFSWTSKRLTNPHRHRCQFYVCWPSQFFFNPKKVAVERLFSCPQDQKSPTWGKTFTRKQKWTFLCRKIYISIFQQVPAFMLSNRHNVELFLFLRRKKFQKAFQFFWLKRKMEPSFGKVHDYYNLSLSLFFLYSQSWLQPRSHYRKPSYIIEAYYLLRGSSKPAAWKATCKPQTTLLVNKV